MTTLIAITLGGLYLLTDKALPMLIAERKRTGLLGKLLGGPRTSP